MENPVQSVAAPALALTKALREGESAFAAKLFGSAAIALRCRNSLDWWERFQRPVIKDVDILIPDFQLKQILPALRKLGCEGDYILSANRIEGKHGASGATVEIWPEPLSVTVQIPLSQKLKDGEEYLGIMDLLLCKLVYKYRDQNCILDILVLLSETQISPQEECDAICTWIVKQMGQNYELYLFGRRNLVWTREFLVENNLKNQNGCNDLIEKLIKHSESAPKSFVWRLIALFYRAFPKIMDQRYEVTNPSNDIWSKTGWKKNTAH